MLFVSDSRSLPDGGLIYIGVYTIRLIAAFCIASTIQLYVDVVSNLHGERAKFEMEDIFIGAELTKHESFMENNLLSSTDQLWYQFGFQATQGVIPFRNSPGRISRPIIVCVNTSKLWASVIQSQIKQLVQLKIL